MKLTPSMQLPFPIDKLPQFGMHGKSHSLYNTFNSKGYPIKHRLSKGYPTKHHILDNECSNDLKVAFSK